MKKTIFSILCAISFQLLSPISKQAIPNVMGPDTDLVQTAELAARTTIEDWIRQVLRESFLQALQQVWRIQHNHPTRDSSPSTQLNSDERDEDTAETHVELSLLGLNSCLSFVERVSKAWQKSLKDEQHERVAQWVEEVYQQGKSRLWMRLEKNDESSMKEHMNFDINDNEETKRHGNNKYSSHQHSESSGVNRANIEKMTKDSEESIEETQVHVKEGNPNGGENPSSKIADDDNRTIGHPNVYCKLRALGRKRKLDSPVLSVQDALNEIKEFTKRHPTYWTLGDDIIDKACLDMSRRMSARNKQGLGRTENSAQGGKAFTKKAVRFQVLPKSIWETKHRQGLIQKQIVNEKCTDETDGKCVESNGMEIATLSAQENEQESRVETMLLASMKKKKIAGKAFNSLQTPSHRSRVSKEHDAPRKPFDVPQSDDGEIPIALSMGEKKILDTLVIHDDEAEDASESKSATSPSRELPLGLFGGLQQVGQTNHTMKNPSSSSDMKFLARDNDKFTRRKEKASIQERLDPNRLRVEDTRKGKSKFLRTENWFDDKKKFYDFDLGWSLLEIKKHGQQKLLCAFSSIESCLEDSDL